MNERDRIFLIPSCFIDQESNELVNTDGIRRESITFEQLTLLIHFHEHKNQQLTLQQLANRVWGYNYAADNRDPKHLRTTISRLRNVMKKVSPQLWSCLKTNHGYNSYTFCPSTDQPAINHSLSYEVTSQTEIMPRLTKLNAEMQDIVTQIESVQKKLQNAQNDAMWQDIYQKQLQLLLLLFQQISNEVEILRASITTLTRQQTYNETETNKPVPLFPTTQAFGFTPFLKLSPLQEVNLFSQRVLSVKERISGLNSLFTNVIRDSLGFAIDPHKLRKYLSSLPVNFESLNKVIGLTEHFDLPDIYNWILQCRNMLSPEEILEYQKKKTTAFRKQIISMLKAEVEAEKLTSYLYELPNDRDMAVLLASLTLSFYTPELFDILRKRYFLHLAKNEQAIINTQEEHWHMSVGCL